LDNSFAPFFQRIADAFIAGDIDWLVSCCSYPLALFVNGEVIVESCAEDSMAAIASRRKLVLGQGVTSILTKLIDVGNISLERFPVRVDWVFLNALSQPVGSNELRYYCKLVAVDDLKIELIEFLQPAFGITPGEGAATVH
jgi:hypothetical protein